MSAPAVSADRGGAHVFGPRGGHWRAPALPPIIPLGRIAVGATAPLAADSTPTHEAAMAVAQEIDARLVGDRLRAMIAT